jgi:hypothetical protein
MQHLHSHLTLMNHEMEMSMHKATVLGFGKQATCYIILLVVY